MAFVIVSRTAPMLTMPVMLALFALMHLKAPTSLIIIGVMVALVGLLWDHDDVRWGPTMTSEGLSALQDRRT